VEGADPWPARRPRALDIAERCPHLPQARQRAWWGEDADTAVGPGIPVERFPVPFPDERRECRGRKRTYDERRQYPSGVRVTRPSASKRARIGPRVLARMRQARRSARRVSGVAALASACSTRSPSARAPKVRPHPACNDPSARSLVLTFAIALRESHWTRRLHRAEVTRAHI
jgi:hypothetical protein